MLRTESNGIGCSWIFGSLRVRNVSRCLYTRNGMQPYGFFFYAVRNSRENRVKNTRVRFSMPDNRFGGILSEESPTYVPRSVPVSRHGCSRQRTEWNPSAKPYDSTRSGGRETEISVRAFPKRNRSGGRSRTDRPRIGARFNRLPTLNSTTRVRRDLTTILCAVHYDPVVWRGPGLFSFFFFPLRLTARARAVRS